LLKKSVGMGIQVSVHNNTKYDPVKGEVLLLGGTKLPAGWSFELSPGEHFSRTDSGISASCPYDLVVYIPNFDKEGNVRRIVHRFKAPAARGNLNIYVQDVIIQDRKRRFVKLMKSNAKKYRTKSPHSPRDRKNSEAYTVNDTGPDSPTMGALPEDFMSLDEDGSVMDTFSPRDIDPKSVTITKAATADDVKIKAPSLRRISTRDKLNKRRETLRLQRMSVGKWMLTDLIIWATKDLMKTTLQVSLLVVMCVLVFRWLEHGGIMLAVSAFLFFIVFTLFHPRILGLLLTNILHYTALNGFPMDFKTVHLWPSIWGSRLYLSILAQDVGFGNPPDFPHKYFVTCRKVSVQLSMKISELFNLVRWFSVPWSPFPSKCNEIVGTQEGSISWHIEGTKMMPPTHHKRRRCYIKVKMGDTSLWKSRVLVADGRDKFDFGVVHIPYRLIKPSEKLIFTAWERNEGGGAKTFLGQRSLSIEDIKACGAGNKHGKSYPLLDRKGEIFSEAWRRAQSKDLNGRGELSVTISADLSQVKSACWGVWETTSLLRPYCVVSDENGAEVGRTETLFGTDHPRWLAISIPVKTLCAESVLHFRMYSREGGEMKDVHLGAARIPLADLASKKSSHALPITPRERKGKMNIANTTLRLTRRADTTKLETVRNASGQVSPRDKILDSALTHIPSPESDQKVAFIAPMLDSKAPACLKVKVKKRGGFRMPVPKWNRDGKGCSELHISRVKATLLASHPAFLGVVDVDHIEFDTVMLNFETHRGEFNVNGVTRLIAEGEMAAAVSRSIPPPFDWPNCLEVHVIRARNLRTISGGTPSPRIVVSLRRQKAASLGHQLNSSPVFDEQFRFVAADPSAVLRISVQNQGLMSGSSIGHWIITLKWLYANPEFCHFNTIRHWGKDPSLPPGTIQGWFPLLDPDLKLSHKAGEMEMQISWKYIEGYGEDWAPPRARALEQLTENSNETKLRLGDMEAVQNMLDRFPLLVRVKRVTIRNVLFYLKDLFLGYKGAMEKRGVKEEALRVDFLESSKQLNLEDYRVGHTINTFMVAWIRSLVPQVAKKVGLVGSATSQILGSFFSSWFEFGGKNYRKNRPAQQMKENQKKLSMFGKIRQHLAAKVTRKTWQRHMVTAHDTDYFLPVTISGIIEKRTSRMKKWVHAVMELKGCTLFYADCDRHGKKLHPEKKLDLSKAVSIKLLPVGHKEIHITEANRQRWIRVPVEVASPSIKEWFREIQSHQRRNLKGIVHLKLARANGIAQLIGQRSNVRVFASILQENGVEDKSIEPASSPIAHPDHSNVVRWADEKGEMYIGPLVETSTVLYLRVSTSSNDPPLAHIKLPLTAITKETQSFSLPWHTNELAKDDGGGKRSSRSGARTSMETRTPRVARRRSAARLKSHSQKDTSSVGGAKSPVGGDDSAFTAEEEIPVSTRSEVNERVSSTRMPKHRRSSSANDKGKLSVQKPADKLDIGVLVFKAELHTNVSNSQRPRQPVLFNVFKSDYTPSVSIGDTEDGGFLIPKSRALPGRFDGTQRSLRNDNMYYAPQERSMDGGDEKAAELRRSRHRDRKEDVYVNDLSKLASRLLGPSTLGVERKLLSSRTPPVSPKSGSDSTEMNSKKSEASPAATWGSFKFAGGASAAATAESVAEENPSDTEDYGEETRTGDQQGNGNVADGIDIDDGSKLSTRSPGDRKKQSWRPSVRASLVGLPVSPVRPKVKTHEDGWRTVGHLQTRKKRGRSNNRSRSLSHGEIQPILPSFHVESPPAPSVKSPSTRTSAESNQDLRQTEEVRISERKERDTAALGANALNSTSSKRGKGHALEVPLQADDCSHYTGGTDTRVMNGDSSEDEREQVGGEPEDSGALQSPPHAADFSRRHRRNSIEKKEGIETESRGREGRGSDSRMRSHSDKKSRTQFRQSHSMESAPMHDRRISVVYKYGTLGGKSKRVIQLGSLHLYAKKFGKQRAKHGKIPYSNIDMAYTTPNRGESHFEIKFCGPMVTGKRHYEADSMEEAETLVAKINVLVRQAKAIIEISGEDNAVSPPVSDDDGGHFSFHTSHPNSDKE